MNIFSAILLGIIEGLTEFLPISSTGHLTIAEKLLGFRIDDAGITAFTAIIQVGATLATIVYFRDDIVRIIGGWLQGIVRSERRNTQEYRFGWAVIIGSIPIAILGLAFKHQVETNLRSLWIVAIALILWSGVMWLADKTARLSRREKDVRWHDTLFIGVAQALALIPGVSRSGATMSAGLFRGLDRVSATRLSFFLGLPALLAAGALESVSKAGDIGGSVGWPATIVATITCFFVALASIRWLLRYIATHSFQVFIIYRICLGLLLIVLLSSGALSAT